MKYNVSNKSEVVEMYLMKVADLSTGPDWIAWIIFIILGILSIVLIFGHGSWLITGYNTASKEEKEKYNEIKYAE